MRRRYGKVILWTVVWFVVIVAILISMSCPTSTTSEQQPYDCCTGYGEVSADGSCMGHGAGCCEDDIDAHPPCFAEDRR